jgi:DnaJ-class molecular chaperone
MGKTFNPQKYNMVFCSVCNGKGKLRKNPYEFDVCKECGGFGLIKNEMGTFEEVKNGE